MHHIYNGPYRSKSDEQGCWVYLCGIHHKDSNKSVHRNVEMARWFKKACQVEWETRYQQEHKDNSREAFIEMFGKSYI